MTAECQNKDKPQGKKNE